MDMGLVTSLVGINVLYGTLIFTEANEGLGAMLEIQVPSTLIHVDAILGCLASITLVAW